MTKNDAVTVLAKAIGGGDIAEAKAVAAPLVDLAAASVGRKHNVGFNETQVTFSLTAGKASYQTGKDILNSIPTIRSMNNVWIDDTLDTEITMMDDERYDTLSAGTSGSGRPRIGKLYYKDKSPFLEVSPKPDSAYSIKATVKLSAQKFEDIPSDYHDIVLAKAMQFARALQWGELATLLEKDGLADMRKDALGSWHGSTISVMRAFGQRGGDMGPDSGNLR